MPSILNLLGTGDEDNKTMKFDWLRFESFDYTEWLRLIWETLTENLVDDAMVFVFCTIKFV